MLAAMTASSETRPSVTCVEAWDQMGIEEGIEFHRDDLVLAGGEEGQVPAVAVGRNPRRVVREEESHPVAALVATAVQGLVWGLDLEGEAGHLAGTVSLFHSGHTMRGRR